MKRLSRHTVVVLVVALLSCAGGMSLAVVAFGQSASDNDAAVPTGDFTGTTPAPTAGYTATVPTTTAPVSPYTTTTPQSTTSTAESTSTPGTSSPTTANGSKDGPSTGSPGGPVPSRATRRGPTHLAFTGGEPLMVGGAGLALMLTGLTLQARRRRVRVQ
jgi:hypothetical protein